MQRKQLLTKLLVVALLVLVLAAGFLVGKLVTESSDQTSRNGEVAGTEMKDPNEGATLAIAAGDISIEDHDLSTIDQYRNPYVGDASNTSTLVYSLPLGASAEYISLGVDSVTVQVPAGTLKESDAANKAAYSSLVIIATIDNVNAVYFYDVASEMAVTRSALTEHFMTQDLASLLAPEEAAATKAAFGPGADLASLVGLTTFTAADQGAR